MFLWPILAERKDSYEKNMIEFLIENPVALLLLIYAQPKKPSFRNQEHISRTVSNDTTHYSLPSDFGQGASIKYGWSIPLLNAVGSVNNQHGPRH